MTSLHKDNMSMQYNVILRLSFFLFLTDNLQFIHFNNFLISALNIDCWYMLEPPLCLSAKITNNVCTRNLSFAK